MKLCELTREAHLAYLAEKAVHHPFQTLTQEAS